MQRLSDAQRDVLLAMSQGWELGRYTGMNSRVVLQKNGIGRGGDTKTVSHATWWCLHKLNLINSNTKYSPELYHLTCEGKAVLETISNPKPPTDTNHGTDYS